MARHARRKFRSSSARRKILVAESNFGLAAGALANTAVATGWLAFPAGQYDVTSFAIPVFQPEDLTHVRSLFNVGCISFVLPNVDRASSFTIGFGVLPFEVEDGNVYINALVATTGIGGIPNPATPSNFDWLWKHYMIVGAHNHAAGVNSWTNEALNDIASQTRGMRKLSHGHGLMWVIGWDWDNGAFSQNGDTLSLTAGCQARSFYKEP